MKQLKLAVAGIGGAVVVFSLALASASSANISHSYKAATPVTNGSIVSLDPARSNYVQLANTGNGTRLIGVAVAGNDSLLAVDATSGDIQVATSGSAEVLVSTAGGNITVGDQIGVSPFNGVGMKAAPGSSIIGLAQTNLDKNTSGTVTQTVTDKSGKSSQVRVGLVRVNIAISTTASGSTENVTGLQKVVKSITGRDVSTVRILISLVVVAVSMLALITLIYASIYGSIVSIGRNPLAKYAVMRTLTSVLGMALLTSVVAGLTLFLLLR